MDGNGGGGYRIEAERWLTISEKLLTAKDFQGAKSFAIRARESDPRLLEFADQIIAVADTLLAGELRVVNYNTGSNSYDYYAILQLPRLSQSMELAATQYRKLALLLNPNRNSLSFAEHAFGLVSEAWMVFSNPNKKAMYDHELQVSQLGQLGQLQQQQQQLGQLGQTGIGSSSSGSHHQHHQHEYSHHQHQQQQQQPHHYHHVQQPQQSNILSFSESPRATQPRMTEPIRPIAQHKPAPEPPQPPSRPTSQQQTQQQQEQQQQLQPQQPQPPLRSSPEQPPPRSTPEQPPPRSTPEQPPLRSTPEPLTSSTQQTRPIVLAQQAARAAAASGQTTRAVARHKSPVTARPVNQKSNAESSARVTQPSRTESEATAFWTACPYCFILYEYPKGYEDCAIRCQKCKRAFQAITIPEPPITGNDTYFCSWGYFPLGFSGRGAGGGLGFGSNWSPFSAMFATPLQGKQKRKVIYKDEVYIDLSDPSDDESDSDDDWDESNKKKSKKGTTPSKNAKRGPVDRTKKAGIQNGDVGGGVGNGSGSKVQGEAARKAEGVSGRKRGAKDLGKLDLNVMFSNEVEEAVPGVSEGNRTGNGEEDNIEGIGFFEGLDEFLSSLPILSVVGDDKVKAS